MSSPDKKDSSRSFSIDRSFDLDRKHSRLVESIRDDDHVVERYMVIPTPEQKCDRRQLNLSDRQSNAEKEAFDAFQQETNGRRLSEPSKPDEQKLRRISRAEEKLRNEQKHAAESLRQSQKEISLFLGKDSADQNSTMLLRKEEERILAKYGYILDEAGGISDAKFQRAIMNAENILRNLDEVGDKIEDIDGYYLKLVNEIYGMITKLDAKCLAGLQHIKSTMLPEWERQVLEKIVMNKRFEDAEKAEEIAFALYNKLGLNDSILERKFRAKNEAYQKKEEDLTSMLNPKARKLVGKTAKNPPKSKKRESKIPVKITSSAVSLVASEHSTAQSLTSMPSVTRHKVSDVGLSSRIPINASMKRPIKRSVLPEIQKKIRPQVSPPKQPASLPRGTISPPKPRPAPTKEYQETPKRQSLLRSAEKNPRLLVQETPKTAPRPTPRPRPDTVQRAQFIVDEKQKLKQKYVEDIEIAKSAINNPVSLAKHLEFLKDQYNYDLETLVKQARMHFMGTPVDLARSVDRLAGKPRPSLELIRSVPRLIPSLKSSRLSLGGPLSALKPIPELPPARILARKASFVGLSGGEMRNLKAKAKREYDAEVNEIRNENDPEIRAQLMLAAHETFKRRKEAIDNLDARKLKIMKQYLKDKNEIAQNVHDQKKADKKILVLEQLFLDDLNELNKNAGIDKEYENVDDSEIAVEVARREREAIAMEEQARKREEQERKAALEARAAERVRDAKQAVADAARESLSRASIAARQRRLNPTKTPKTPVLPPELAAKAAAAKRVADTKAAAASASRASLLKRPRRSLEPTARGPETPDPKVLAAQRLAATKKATASASGVSLTRMLASRPSSVKRRVPMAVTPKIKLPDARTLATASASSVSIPAGAKSAPTGPIAKRISLPPEEAAKREVPGGVASVKAQAASRSRAMALKTPLSKAGPVQPADIVPSKTPARKASQKFVAGTEGVRLRALAKKDYETAVAAAKRDIDDPQELAELLDYLKEEYKTQVDFIRNLDNEKLKEKKQYLADLQTTKQIEAPSVQERAIATLQANLISRLQALDKYAGQPGREVGSILEEDILAEIQHKERLDKIAEREMKKKLANVAKARELEEATEKLARIATRATPSHKSVPQRVPQTPRKPSAPAVSASIALKHATTTKNAPYRKMVFKKLRSLDAPLTAFIETQRQPLKSVKKTASQRYIGVDLIKLRAKAKEEYQRDEKIAKETIENEEERKSQFKQIKEKYQQKLNRIKTLDDDMHEAKSRFLTHVKEAQDTIRDPAELEIRLNDLRANLVSELKQLEENVGAERREIQLPSDIQLAQEVARRNRLAQVAQQQRTAKKEAEKVIKAQAEELALKIAKSRVSLVPYRTPKAPSASQAKTIKAPATAPARRKSILEMAKTPSVMRKLSVPKLVHHKKELDPKIQKFLEERKAAATPKKPFARRASEKYITGTNKVALNAKAKQEFEAQVELAKQTAQDEEELQEQIEYLQNEYESRLDFIKQMDVLKQYVQKECTKKVLAARKTITDNDILKERLDILRDDLKNKQAYIEEVAGLPRKPAFRSPNAEVKQQIGDIVYRMTAPRPRQSVPSAQAAHATSETPKGRPGVVRRDKRLSLRRSSIANASKPSDSVSQADKRFSAARAIDESQTAPSLPSKLHFYEDKAKMNLMQDMAEEEAARHPPSATRPAPISALKSPILPLISTPTRSLVKPSGSPLQALPGKPPSQSSPISPFERPSRPLQKSSPKTPLQEKTIRRAATPATIPRLQFKKSATPLRSLQKARLIEPEAQFVSLKPLKCRLRGKSVDVAQEKSLVAVAQTWKMPRSTCKIVRRKKLFERSLNEMGKNGVSNKEFLQVVEGGENIETPISRTKIQPIAKHMGLDVNQQVEKVLDKATNRSNVIQETLASVPPTVAESIQQRDHSIVSPLAAEEADGIFKMMMDEVEGIDLAGEPGEIVRLIVPSEGPTLVVAGNAVESPSKGVITDQVPVREINALSNRNAEEFTSTIKQQPPHKFPVESIAAKRLPEEQPIKVPLTSEPRSKEDYIQHDLLLHSFQVENYFQARGSTFPKWFPGIYTVYPEESPKLVLKKSPSEVLLRAWQIMKPKQSP